MQSATNPSVTKQEELIATLAADPTLNSQRAIGEKAGLTQQGTAHHLAKPVVQALVVSKVTQQRDNARDVISLAERQVHRLTRLIDRALPEGSESQASIDDVVKALGASLGTYTKMLELRDRYGIGTEQDASPYNIGNHWRRAMRRGHAAGKGTGRLLGWRGDASD